MLSLLASWVLFPALLAAAALGHGLLIQRAGAIRLPGALLVPVGLAGVVVVASLAVAGPGTAQLALPVVVFVGFAGLMLDRPWRGLRLDRAATTAGLGVFAIYAAPVVLSGQATFTGFIKLDDTSTFLALTDHVLRHGRDFGMLHPSTHEAIVAAILPNGYPLGSLLPLGAIGPLTGQDIAWLYQPWMAFLAAMVALCAYTIAREVLGPRTAAVAAFASAGSTLLFGFALWGGVKEMASAWLVATAAALVPGLIRARGVRGVLPAAVVTAAVALTMTIGGEVWVGPALLLALAVGGLARVRAGQWRLLLDQILVFVLVTAVLSIPAIGTAKHFSTAAGPLKTQAELGNLIRPLKWQQVFGVWLGHDFRIDPEHQSLTTLLIWLVAIGIVAGVAVAIAKRAWGVLAYLIGTAVGSLYITRQTGPWVDAKTLAIISPVAPLAGLVGYYGLRPRREYVRRLFTVAAALIAGGVVVGNAMAYHQAWLAPRDHLQELAKIGKMAAGEGPTLLPVYDPYAARHFLRQADGESASELRTRAIPLQSGDPLPEGAFADIDAFSLDAVTVYRSLVVPRSPIFSRPPAPYRRVWQGRFYELWQRDPGSEQDIVSHKSFGTSGLPESVATCDQVRAIAKQATGAGGTLAAVERPAGILVSPQSGTHPSDWGAGLSNTAFLAPKSDGDVRVPTRVTTPGVYDVYLAGSFAGAADVIIDDHKVGTARGLANAGNYVPVGHMRLVSGAHIITTRYRTNVLAPGSGAPYSEIGYVVLEPAGDHTKVEYVAPKDYPRLCNRSLDWIEALRKVPQQPSSGA